MGHGHCHRHKVWGMGTIMGVGNMVWDMGHGHHHRYGMWDVGTGTNMMWSMGWVPPWSWAQGGGMGTLHPPHHQNAP